MTKKPTEPARPVGRSFVERKRKGWMRKVTSYLPSDVGAELRRYAFEHGQDMSQVITDALRAHLGMKRSGA